MQRRILILGVGLCAILALLPSADSGGLNPPLASLPDLAPCNPTQNPHTYSMGEAAWTKMDTETLASVTAAGVFQGTETAYDGCGQPGGDGDPETGFGGGAFPAGACVVVPSIAHHANAPGSAYYIVDSSPMVDAALLVGTDGGSVDGACTGGNGLVSNDPTTDPFDCASGTIGFSNPMTGAFIGANIVGTTCTPAGGFVAAFVLQGPINPTGSAPVNAVSTKGYIGDAGF